MMFIVLMVLIAFPQLSLYLLSIGWV